MLLPSALTCDALGPPLPRLRPAAALYASPPSSPPSASSPSSTIFSTCRTLQSMLSGSSQMPTPPPMQVPLSPSFKLRLRSRQKDHRAAHSPDDNSTAGGSPMAPRMRITKRAPPRGANKRRRSVSDDDVEDDISFAEVDGANTTTAQEEVAGPSTPKRTRFAPEILPIGLTRSDFRNLLEREDGSIVRTSDDEHTNGEWRDEDDRLLVELVLEKLRLSKNDWEECARNLGRDKNDVGKRWKSLMGAGEVGLKRTRRPRIHGSWR